MTIPDILLSVSLLCLGGAVVGTGIVCLSRRDRRSMERNRQDACGWHQWQVTEAGAAVVCSLCGKKSPKVHAARDLSPERVFTEHTLP
jgi:hypothetical protein